MIPILNFETNAIESAIKAAELRTRGEIRVCVERRRVDDVEARAREVFAKLGMIATAERNGVLVYVHLRQKNLVILGDSGIDAKVPQGFWRDVCDAVLACFKRKDMTVGVVLGIMLIAEQLALHFPCDATERVNELPDAVAIGDDL